jgi:hypothetical protein
MGIQPFYKPICRVLDLNLENENITK